MFPQFCDFDSPALGGFLTYSLLTNVLSGSDDGSTTGASAQTSPEGLTPGLGRAADTEETLTHRTEVPLQPRPCISPSLLFLACKLKGVRTITGQ